MLENKHLTTEEIDQEMIDLVVARLNTMPSDVTLCIGGEESLSLREVIENVKNQNESGQAIVKEQIEYLRSLKDLLSDGVG